MSSAQQPSVRDGNLADVLSLVHTEGPISRAVITRRTGLNRSTVGDLVAALNDAGLVREEEPEPSLRVGRPSPVVVADPDVVVVTANPEVDALTMGVFSLGRRVRLRVRHEYDGPPSPDRVATLIASQIDLWRGGDLADATIAGIGLAVPGLVRAADGLVRTAPHLAWEDADVRSLVTAATGLPAVIGNDANLGVLAEHRFGAARGARDVVYLNGGDGGIGSGIIANGALVAGREGYAGEFGHHRVASGLTLEEEVSRARLLRVLGVRAMDDAALSAAVRQAASGDALAAEVGRQLEVLAGALADIVGALDPSTVVLGGFLTDLLPADVDRFTAEVVAQALPSVPRSVAIRPAELVENRLLQGAAEAIFDDRLLAPEALERWLAGRPSL